MKRLSPLLLSLILGACAARPPGVEDALVPKTPLRGRLGIGLDVVVNGRNLGLHVPMETLRRDTEARGGVVVSVASYVG